MDILRVLSSSDVMMSKKRGVDQPLLNATYLCRCYCFFLNFSALVEGFEKVVSLLPPSNPNDLEKSSPWLMVWGMLVGQLAWVGLAEVELEVEGASVT